jgi:pectate lyase
MEKWIKNLKEAADTEEGMRFWVNNESFTADFAPADISRFIEQIEASEKYAETHITFSWNHYYNPLNDAAAESYHNALKEYLKLRLEIE